MGQRQHRPALDRPELHWVKQFHPKYNTAEKDFKDLNTKVETWTNPDMPTLNAWMLTKYEAGKSLTADRNPYYYAVDTDGNQLPYIDGRRLDQRARTPRLSCCMVRQGTIDLGHFHDFTLADISTLKDNEDAGGYEVVLWDSGSGTAMMYFWNYDHVDPKIRANSTAPRNSSRPCPSPSTAPRSRRPSTTRPAF